MSTTEQRRSLEELNRLADEVYDRRVRPALRPEDDDKFVAIDVDGEEYEIDASDMVAVARLRTRIPPTAEVWLSRVGRRAAYTMRWRR